MSDALRFLRTVVPACGVCCISTNTREPRRWRDRPFTDRERAAAYGLENAQFADVYMALSSYEVDGQFRRTQERALWQRALWADLDVDPQKARSGAGYADIDTAFAALTSFVTATGLPHPLVVASGHGLHVYWPFSEDLPQRQWRPLAQQFAGVCGRFGLIVDPHREGDAASVLRLPGTLNHKNGGALPVDVRDWGEVSDPVKLAEQLFALPAEPVSRFAPTAPAQPEGAAVPPGMAAFFADDFAPVDGPPRAWEGVVESCPQVREMASAPYPAWMLAARTLLHTTGGAELIDQLSRLDPQRYDAAAVQKLVSSLSQRMDVGPGTCAAFQRCRPGLCANCPYAGKVKTPWSLGTLPAPAAVAMPASAVETADLSAGELRVDAELGTFTVTPWRSDDGRWQVMPGHGIYLTERDDDGVPHMRLISPLEIYIHTLCVDWTAGVPDRTYIMRKVVPGHAPVDLPFRIADALGSGKLEVWLAQCGLLPPPSTRKLVFEFMNAYLSAVQNDLPEVRVRTHFGWDTDVDRVTGKETPCLIVGQTAFGATGDRTVRLDERAQGLAADFREKGSLDAWLAVPKLYRQLDQPFAQLMMCASFGAPLMKAGLGTATNVAYSLWDAAGGKGKSSVLRACASVWGDPARLLMGRNDTAAARFQHFSVHRNLPVLIDEITSMRDADLASLLYDIVNGREKARSSSGGGALLARGAWDTVTMMTSNTSIYEALREYRQQTTATSMRVIEMQCDFQDYTGLPEARVVNQALSAARDNHGVAGRAWARFLAANPEVLDAAGASAEAFAVKHAASADERFWLYGMSIPLFAGRVAGALGLLDYDFDALERWCIKTLLPALREAVKHEHPQGDDIVANFLNDHLDATLIVQCASRRQWSERYGSNRQAPPEQNPAVPFDPYVVQMPTRKVLLRRELDTGRVYVSTTALADWARDHGISVDTMLTDLSARGYLPWGKSPARRELGRDVPALPPVRPRVYVMKFAQQKEQDNEDSTDDHIPHYAEQQWID